MAKTNVTEVAIILLNWNSYDDIVDCLESLKTQEYKDFEVFIVDNCSRDNSYELLKDHYSEGNFDFNVNFKKAEENLGFAGGNNIAIKDAYSRNFNYMWLLNSDTIVTPTTLSELIHTVSSDSQIGIVGSKIYYYDSKVLWFAGGELDLQKGISPHIGQHEIDKGQYDEQREVEFITGCSLLVRREVIETVGYMREDYFLYYEDSDYNVRVKDNGWKIFYVPSSIVYHKVSHSSGGEESLAPYVAYYNMRNSYVMMRRNRSARKLIPFSILFWKLFKKHVKILVKNQDKKVLRSKYIFYGLIDALRQRMGKHPDL
ncbi:glycosyltransferase [Aquibacillus halophilus]|uniref:Glycosyltransferase n=1 Tax=Aquibacillus halophilus TaxID=930132 RepID=A0A6A8DJ17_9BACI|nr:glycosyltransferase family 2 protein [Aquibacillus halophilus]MRH41302.1 glycosyltransferase [Aquibacillus halophilus]